MFSGLPLHSLACAGDQFAALQNPQRVDFLPWFVATFVDAAGHSPFLLKEVVPGCCIADFPFAISTGHHFFGGPLKGCLFSDVI